MVQKKPNMTFEQAKAIQDSLQAVVDQTSRAFQEFLDRYPRGPMNLTPDFVKKMPEYQKLNVAYQNAFQRLRRYNADFTRAFKKENAAFYQAKLKASQEQKE